MRTAPSKTRASGGAALAACAALLCGAAPPDIPLGLSKAEQDALLKEMTRREIEKAEATVRARREANPNAPPPEPPGMPARPPVDEEAYRAAFERLQRAPAAEVFGFAAWNGTLPEENLGNDVRIGGATVRAASMMIPVAPDRVFETYAAQLSKKFQVNRGTLQSKAGYLSFRDPADGFMRTLTFVALPEGTLVLASLGDPSKIAPPKTSMASSFPADIPMPPLAERPVDLRSGSGADEQVTRNALAAERRPDMLVAFFNEAMRQKGWSLDRAFSQTRSSIRLLAFSREDRHCTITIIPAPPDLPGCPLSVVCIQRRPEL